MTRPRWSLADARPQIVMLPKPKKKKPLAAGESDQGPCVRAIWGTEGLLGDSNAAPKGVELRNLKSRRGLQSAPKTTISPAPRSVSPVRLRPELDIVTATVVIAGR